MADATVVELGGCLAPPPAGAGGGGGSNAEIALHENADPAAEDAEAEANHLRGRTTRGQRIASQIGAFFLGTLMNYAGAN